MPRIAAVRRPRAVAPIGSPPAERARHDDLVLEAREERRADGSLLSRAVGLRVVSQTPLDRYRAQGHVSPEQWWGGDRLRVDFERGDFEMLARPRWDGMPGGGQNDPAAVSLAACAARRSYIQALRSVPKRLSPVIVHVCCLRGYAADWALGKGLPRSDGMALLRLGLDLLADHYGTETRPPRQKSPIGDFLVDVAPRES